MLSKHYFDSYVMVLLASMPETLSRPILKLTRIIYPRDGILDSDKSKDRRCGSILHLIILNRHLFLYK